MIFDEKQNLDFYRNLGIEGRYAKAVDFLKNTESCSIRAWKVMRSTEKTYMQMLPLTPLFRGKRLSMRHMSIIPISVRGSREVRYDLRSCT